MTAAQFGFRVPPDEPRPVAKFPSAFSTGMLFSSLLLVCFAEIVKLGGDKLGKSESAMETGRFDVVLGDSKFELLWEPSLGKYSSRNGSVVFDPPTEEAGELCVEDSSALSGLDSPLASTLGTNAFALAESLAERFCSLSGAYLIPGLGLMAFGSK
mmetsp:Transcript_2612/g.5174  ORF Transcript_2612/g.5174 Transcript_2612/m.5174 type:complete len:156 (-) Transcript_2612:109-576(-)|eukprot:CAMPEP_0167833390 /NCGR_PEP_ID=MMETSP0112_2-20121227/14984_1 /TAXON_ID=91324 /ORGANISM="Lotharella globosa, Strain CCCM811" /LENGTH=155 /DNA_ID=CAMNT_0007738781 /DNA_START=357 /DNA_END=824 /DNA_ORIENTATION=+